MFRKISLHITCIRFFVETLDKTDTVLRSGFFCCTQFNCCFQLLLFIMIVIVTVAHELIPLVFILVSKHGRGELFGFGQVAPRFSLAMWTLSVIPRGGRVPEYSGCTLHPPRQFVPGAVDVIHDG